MNHLPKEYEDIIHLEHHRSRVHPPMSLHDRAAQFAPFAALKGYDSAIEESARLTAPQVQPGEEEARVLNARTRLLLEHIAEQPLVRITYFVPDARKQGGAYRVKEGKLRRIDEVLHRFYFTDRSEIAIENIIKIEGDWFDNQG